MTVSLIALSDAAEAVTSSVLPSFASLVMSSVLSWRLTPAGKAPATQAISSSISSPYWSVTTAP